MCKMYPKYFRLFSLISKLTKQQYCSILHRCWDNFRQKKQLILNKKQKTGCKSCSGANFIKNLNTIFGALNVPFWQCHSFQHFHIWHLQSQFWHLKSNFSKINNNFRHLKGQHYFMGIRNAGVWHLNRCLEYKPWC